MLAGRLHPLPAHPARCQPGRGDLVWLDDCSRYALSVTAHRRVTGPIVLASFRATITAHAIPTVTVTDNGMVFTTRLSGGKGGRNGFETEPRRLHVRQKNSRPNHPTTCGKVERFQQTMKNSLAAQPAQPATIAELQTLLDDFVELYNTARPHRSLPHRATPATIHTTRPKATVTGNRDADTHNRIRHDKIDDSGVVTLPWPATCTTSASAEPTPEPTSSCSSRTYTSASSPPPPANHSAN